MPELTEYDLVIVGCGAAGLSAAVTFSRQASTLKRPAKIAVLERSTKEKRGGATRWTGAFLRISENREIDPNWIKQMQEVSKGKADLDYCKTLVREAPSSLKFIEDLGVELLFDRFPLAHSFGDGKPGMVPPGRPNGGGAAIVEALAGVLEENEHVHFHYETEAVKLTVSDAGAVNGVTVRGPSGLLETLRARSVLLACGGFEGNQETLTRYLGDRAWELPLIAPGIANNRGDGLRMALELGADTAGQFDMIHAEPVDARSSAADAVLYGYPGGIFLNEHYERFFDEGRNTWDNTFEHVGYEIWKNQNQRAYWIADAKTLSVPGIEYSMLSDVPPVQANTLAELAAKLELDGDKLQTAIHAFNAATQPGTLDFERMDGKHTVGIFPPKSNWATPLDTAPFVGIPLTAAICFTYGGLRTDVDARVVAPSGVPIPNLYAAGEVTGLYYGEYPPATSVLRSLTFGRIAGSHAANALF